MADLETREQQFFNKNTSYSVVFDDDGRVGYVYLLTPCNEIVSDVWLYNRCATPLTPEWETGTEMPFANSEAYCISDTTLLPITDVSEITVSWDTQSTDKHMAKIFLRQVLIGCLVEGEKPGWSLLAKKNGPLARIHKLVLKRR